MKGRAPATSTTLPLPSSWRRAAAAVGVALVKWDSMPGLIAVELDQEAAEALGRPGHVLVELAARVLTVTPCNAGDVGARATWGTRAGGLAFTARVSVRKRALGRWPVWAHGAGLVLDLAGDQARRAA